MKFSSKRVLAGAMVASLALAACGGDDDVTETSDAGSGPSGEMSDEPAAPGDAGLAAVSGTLPLAISRMPAP